MANNIEVTEGTGTTIKTTDNAGVHTPHHNVDSSALPSGAATSAKQDDTIAALAAIQGSDSPLTTLEDVEAAVNATTAAIAGGIVVDLGANNDVTVTGSVTANAGTNLNTSALALETGGNLATIAAVDFATESGGNLDDINTATAAAAASLANLESSNIDAGTAGTPSADVVSIQGITSMTPVIVAGGGTAGSSGTAVLTVQGIASGTALPISVASVPSHAVTNAGTFAVQSLPSTTGGLDIFRSLDLDESEEEVKATAGSLYKLRITNFRTSSAVFVKIYNATAASVSVGTTTPVDTIPVPVAASASNPTVITENFGGVPLSLGTAICLAATTALADNDTGAPGANEVVVSAYYK